MMRVLHISPGNLYGGVETLLITLARFRNVCPTMEPEFAVCFEGRLSQELAATGAPVHFLGAVRIRQPLSIRRGRRCLSELLCLRNFDSVICHMSWPHAVFGPVVRAAHLPLIAWRHDASDGRHWLERWASLIPPELTICNSGFTESRLKSFAPNLPIRVIHNPVEPRTTSSTDEERESARSEIGVASTTTVIIQVSRMEAWKGHALHLRALSKLRDEVDWVCWIVGGAQRPSEARYIEQLRAIAVDLGINDRVVFLGQRKDVRRLLAAADIFCQPNTGPEPFGIVFIEALYGGLPVVTTDLGGGAEIVDPSCGILAPPGDDNALARSLHELIANPELRAALGSSGPERARRLCDPAAQIKKLSEVIGTLNRSSPSGFPGVSA